MSVLIKDMKMPSSCIDCPFMVSRENDDCILQSSEANAAFENWDDMKLGCPLIEIPSSGRLLWDKHVIETFGDAILDEAERNNKHVRATHQEIAAVVAAVPTIVNLECEE